MEVEVLVMKNPFVLASELDLGTPLLAKTNVGTMDPFVSSLWLLENNQLQST